MFHTFKTNLGFLLAFCLVGFSIQRSAEAYYGTMSRISDDGRFLMNLCFTAEGVQTLTVAQNRIVPNITPLMNNTILPALKAAYPDENFGDTFNPAQLADYGLFEIYLTVWPRSGAVGLFDFQVMTFYRLVYQDVGGIAYWHSPGDFLLVYGFYGVFQTNEDITSKRFENIAWTYVSDNVMFPFYGTDSELHAYDKYSVRQYPLGYNGITQIRNVSGQHQFNVFNYGTIQEMAYVLNRHVAWDWGEGATNPVTTYFFHGLSTQNNWYFPANPEATRYNFEPVSKWSTYDYDSGTEPDAHEFYVKHDRVDPNDDWGDIPDDPSGTSTTVEVGPDTRESYSEKIDEYFGYENSEPDTPEAPNFSSAESELGDPNDPRILTEYQYDSVRGSFSNALNSTPIGDIKSKFQSGLGSSGGSTSLPVFSINLPPEFNTDPIDIDFSIVTESPYNTWFNFLRLLIVMHLFILVCIFIYKDLRDSIKD